MIGLTVTTEWRCWREDGTYGPPCTDPQERREHQWSGRHWNCTWIAYVELGQDDEPKDREGKP